LPDDLPLSPLARAPLAPGDPSLRALHAGDPAANPSTETGAGTGATFTTRALAPGVTLHLNTDARRKTNLVNVFFVAPLGDDATARALIPNCLMRGTRRLPSLPALTRETERLYGASLSTDVRKVGERHAIQFRLEFVNDRYLPGEESILDETIGFLREVITDPHLVEGGFDPGFVDGEKETHRRLIESLLNDKRAFAVQRCVELACADEPFHRHEQGRVEDLPALDAAVLTARWRAMLSEDETHIYFSGNLPIDQAEARLAPLLEGIERAPASFPPLPAPRSAGEPREVVERMQIQQAKLVMSYRTEVGFADPGVPGLVVGNGVLGSFPHSKLFVNVREGASLCYYASSFLERSQAMMFISSGIELARFEEARDLIGVQIADVAAGRFSDEELTATKVALESRLRMIDDSPAALMDIDLSWLLNGVAADLTEYRRRIAAVTREDVVAAFAKVRPDVIYLLAPEEPVPSGEEASS